MLNFCCVLLFLTFVSFMKMFLLWFLTCNIPQIVFFPVRAYFWYQKKIRFNPNVTYDPFAFTWRLRSSTRLMVIKSSARTAKAKFRKRYLVCHTKYLLQSCKKCIYLFIYYVNECYWYLLIIIVIDNGEKSIISASIWILVWNNRIFLTTFEHLISYCLFL